MIRYFSKIGSNWGGAWATASLNAKFIDIFDYHNRNNDGNIVGLLNGEVIIVSGITGIETYQVPNTAAFIASDTDYIWFRTNGTQRMTTTAELVGYDLQKTVVKYSDSAPYLIDKFAIIRSGHLITASERDALFKEFWLPIMWDNFWNDYGHEKGNRNHTVQNLWTPETAPIVSKAEVNDSTKNKVEITFNELLDENFVPNSIAFTLAGKTINNVEIISDKVILTVTVPYISSDNITVNYINPVNNALRSALTGLLVNSFTNQAVVNNIVYIPVVGDSWQGGTVAYILQSGDPGYESDKIKGLILGAMQDGVVWISGGSTQTTCNNNTSPNIGTGQANTNAMISQSDFIEGAAKVANDYSNGGYSDWYLPSLNELLKINSNRALFTLQNYNYWSSTERTWSGRCDVAEYVQWINGGVYIYTKNNAAPKVLPIRSFSLIL